MKAIVQPAYGSPDVLQLRDVDTPRVTRDDDVLVRVHAASINRADWVILTGRPVLVRAMGFGVLKPRHSVPGADVAGQVEAVGSGVTHLRPGDEVYGDLSGCGLGAFAEYVCVPAERLAPRPASLSCAQAAAMPLAATTALQGLRDMRRVAPGDRVLVNGASGGVGTFAVQIAHAYGAEVTAVCSTRNIDMVKSIGAHAVVDYTCANFTRQATRYDVIYDLVGNHALSDLRRVLTPTGTLIMAGGNTDRAFGPLDRMVLGALMSPFIGQHIRQLASTTTQRDLLALSELVELGKVTPVLDRHYDGLDGVPDALRYHGQGHAQGKTVITIADEACFVGPDSSVASRV